MTEIELLKAVKKNDDDALKEIIQNYRNMIYSIINSYSLGYGDYLVSEEELFQEGCIGLYEACKSYNKVDNCKFSTYAYVIIKRKINKCLYDTINIYKNETTSFDRYSSVDRIRMFDNKYVYDNPISYYKNPFKKYDYKTRMARLDKFDQKIVRLRLQKYSYQEIAKMLNVPKKKIDNRLQYIKKNKFHVS